MKHILIYEVLDNDTKFQFKDLLCAEEVGRMNFGELLKNPLALFDIMIKKVYHNYSGFIVSCVIARMSD